MEWIIWRVRVVMGRYNWLLRESEKLYGSYRVVSYLVTKHAEFDYLKNPL